MTTSTTTRNLSIEHEELLATLAKHRGFLRHTVAGITDDQARQRPTASELCLGGLVKHVAAMEAGWIRFVVEGTAAMACEMTPESFGESAAASTEERRVGKRGVRTVRSRGTPVTVKKKKKQ